MRYLAIDLGDKRTGFASGDDVVGLVPYVVPGPMRELRSYSSGLNTAA